MTFDAFENSLESGTPVEIYVIELGAETFLFTSAQIDFDVAVPDPLAGTYTAVAITRGQISQGAGDQTEDKLEIVMPADNEFVARYVNVAPANKAQVSLYQIHRDDPDAEIVLLFRGVMGSISFQKDVREATLQVQALTKARSRTIPRVTFQGLCNHMLYDGRCKLVESSFEFNLTVTVVTDNVITVPGAGSIAIGLAPAGDAFEAGFVENSGDFRLVINQSGDDLTLLIPFATSPLGLTVRCVVGCKHRLELDCDDKFSNVVNYGGYPFVPLKNPFTTGLD